MNFESSPKTGTMAHDFALWNLDKTETRLSGIWSQYDYTIVEFGSFT